MTDKRKDFVTTASWEEFSSRTGFSLPRRPKINRELFSNDELDCFESYFVSLCTDLTIYNQLFGSEEAIAVLNEFNSFIFSRIQRSFIEKICLKIACLMDPPRSGKNENMSLERFVAKASNDELNKVFGNLSEEYARTGIKTWRNKVLAHTDLKTVMGEFDFELKLEAGDINQLIRGMQDLIDLIKDPEVYTDHEITLPFGSDGTSFIDCLNKINNQQGHKA